MPLLTMVSRGMLPSMDLVSQFSIRGLFGSRHVDLIMKGNRLILVGPNGIGKSSVATIFYLFLSRQWQRLLDFQFDDISLTIGSKKITAHRADISGLFELGEVLQSVRVGSRPGALVQRLQETGDLQRFLTTNSLSSKDRSYFAKQLDAPAAEVSHFHRYLLQRMERGSFSAEYAGRRTNIDEQIKGLGFEKLIYLPTYRRIEKDIRDIFPEIEERLRRYGDSPLLGNAGRKGGHYVELVRFGMEDVRATVNARLQSIKDYSLGQMNELSAAYLRDVIRGTANQIIASDLESLSQDDLQKVLARVGEGTLPREDKDTLGAKVQNMKGKSVDQISDNDRYLAHYFSKLVHVHTDIAFRERDIRAFVDVCNAYLDPSKRMHYDETASRIFITDEAGSEIDLSMLSSGEKQVVSIFAHLYLEEAANQVVIIDEPELSLSVPWQQRFLPDIISSGRCALLLAVTHSPFIYENDLVAHSVDLRRMTKRASHG